MAAPATIQQRSTVSDQLATLVSIPGAPVRHGVTRRLITGCWNGCLVASDCCCSLGILIALLAALAAFYQFFGWVGSVFVRHLSR